MKKIMLLMLLVPGMLFAADAVAPAAPVAAVVDWKVLIQQILTNGGLMLIGFLVSMVPGPVGAWLKKIVDFLAANLRHEDVKK